MYVMYVLYICTQVNVFMYVCICTYVNVCMYYLCMHEYQDTKSFRPLPNPTVCHSTTDFVKQYPIPLNEKVRKRLERDLESFL